MAVSLESCGPFHNWQWNIRPDVKGKAALPDQGQ